MKVNKTMALTLFPVRRLLDIRVCPEITRYVKGDETRINFY